MPTTAQLKATADALEAVTSAHDGNASDAGYWRRIALALEEGVGASTSANPTREGWMLRAALAAEATWGGSGAEENRTHEGLLKRVVDAMEAEFGVAAGSLGHRLATVAPLVAYLGPELVVNGTFDADRTGWGNHAALPPDVIEWSAGRLHINNDGSSRGLCGQTGVIAVTNGKTYRYSLDVEIMSANSPTLTINLSAYATGRKVIATQDSLAIGVHNLSGTWNCTVSENVHFVLDFAAGAVRRAFFDNISLRQLGP